MTQRSSEMHAERNSAEDVDAMGPPATDPNVIASGFRAVTTAVPSSEEAPGTDGTRRTRGGDPGPDEDAEGVGLEERVHRLERQNRWMRYGLFCLVLISGYAVFDRLFPEGVTIQKTMMESKELRLLDSEGNARLFLRMYSRVPVLQILDSNGKPRMSLGLRFDDTPFVDLSDRTGRTRATFEMTEHDAPALRLFDEHGDTTFAIN